MEECKILLKYLDFLVNDSTCERVESDELFAPLFFYQGRRSQSVCE